MNSKQTEKQGDELIQEKMNKLKELRKKWRDSFNDNYRKRKEAGTLKKYTKTEAEPKPKGRKQQPITAEDIDKLKIRSLKETEKEPKKRGRPPKTLKNVMQEKGF